MAIQCGKYYYYTQFTEGIQLARVWQWTSFVVTGKTGGGAWQRTQASIVMGIAEINGVSVTAQLRSLSGQNIIAQNEAFNNNNYYIVITFKGWQTSNT